MDATRPPLEIWRKPVHLRFIKGPVLDCSLQDPLKPQSRDFLGEGDPMVAKGSCRWFRSGEQWTASYFILGGKALHSPDLDGECPKDPRTRLVAKQRLPSLQLARREKQVQERGHQEGDPLLLSNTLEFLPTCHLKVLRAQLCPKGKTEKNTPLSIQQVGSISDKLTMLRG